ncbi:MAG: hypothetical protein EU548_01310 [Promethearchaeota archaeon]|nr:MAG: hypothetical protein EU548_01310 [Candidatus Lokiarchaeota archaeon]
MIEEIIEYDFDDGKNLGFKKAENLDRILKIIEKNNIAQLKERIVGIWAITYNYVIDDFEFQLIFHEDMGILLRLPIERDHQYDKQGYDMLRSIGKKIVNIINSRRK